MKINLKTVLLLVGIPLILFSPCALAHTDVTAEQARELIDSTNDLIVVDVREPSEYCDTKGHIPGALNYPWYSGVLEAQYGELPMDGPVLVVCGSGGRSNQAANFLDSEDFTIVYDMLGGMRVWTWETEPCVDPDSKYGGGTGEPNDPYQIATAEDLILLGETPEDYDKHFVLTADIDLDPNLPGGQVFDRAVIAPDTNDIEPDFQGTSFTGVFDGNGHSVSNLTIRGEHYLGLIGNLRPGFLEGGEVRNLSIVDVNITGSGDYVGGIVGSNYGFINQCNCTGSIIGNESVGGLVGENGWTALIAGSYNISYVNGYQFVGGLVGWNGYGRITESYNKGSITGAGAGGLVGINFGGTIKNSYNTGTITGQGKLGGLMGETIWGDITYCYNSGAVIGGLLAGGLTGDASGYDAINKIFTSCFWDTQTSGQMRSSGGFGNPGGTGKTTAEMQTAGTFLEAGWDFVGETDNGTEDIWSICEGTNYPRFVWQIQVGDFVCPDGITIDDFSFFMEHWLDDNCDLSNGYCQGTDLDQSGTVDINDLEILLENWLVKN